MSQEKKLPFTPLQLAAARQLLGKMSQEQLAKVAGVSERTIEVFEKGGSIPHQSTIAKILAALENRGIEFTNGDAPGVRIRPDKAIIPV